ncbi:MAG: hypothetical protein CMH57_03960 [Myxococcales bacterium]|nr:hypothetical protein [Myxococcales bacterium]
MALKREMKINIGPDGKVTIEVTGVPGGECIDFTKFIEEELGEVVDREHTAEFYQQAEGEEHIVVGGSDDDS